jgi:amino acid transporter
MLNESEITVMTFLRKLEIGCGTVTGLLAIATAANMMSADLEAMRRLGRDFPVPEELLVASSIYVLPGLLVAMGSYVHVSRHRKWGLPLVIIASLCLVILFLLLLFAPAFYGPSPFAWLNLSLATLAIVTVIVALLVHFRERS